MLPYGIGIYHFCPFPFFFFCFVCLLIVSINQTKGSTIAACSSQGWHLTDHFFRKFMSDACAYACFVLYIYVETNFADFLRIMRFVIVVQKS